MGTCGEKSAGRFDNDYGDVAAADADANVAVHIRRGDLIRYIRRRESVEKMLISAENRYVAVSAYVSVLEQLLSKLKKLGKKNVRVHIFCEDEGMKKTTKKKSKTKGARASSPPLLVPDLNGTFVDVSKV